MIACDGKQTADKTPKSIYPGLKHVELMSKGEYTLNQLTGDSIKPIVSSNGDTVLTGHPKPMIGKEISTDSVNRPKVVPITTSKQIVNAHPNLRQVPKNLNTNFLNEDSLVAIPFREIVDDTSHYILNSTGDKVKTGVKIAVKGKKVNAKLPDRVSSLPPRFKDAANGNLRYLDVDQGLPSSYLREIVIDNNGYVWLGTWGAGVSRYDGTTFTNFTDKGGLSHNTVRSVLADRNGNLWFGTWGGGLCLYDGSSFTHFTEEEGFIENYIRCILEDKDGNIWIGTDAKGVSRYDGTSFTHFTEKEGLSNNTVWAMTEDKSGNIWFATNGGVSCFNGTSFTHLTKKEGLTSNEIKSILEDQFGNLWFGTEESGVIQYRPSKGDEAASLTSFTEKEGLSNNTIWSMVEDRYGNIWFGTDGGGLITCKPLKNGRINDFTHFTEKEGLSHNSVMAITEDRNGNIWLGTNGGGLSIYNANSFVHFTEKEGLAGNVVVPIIEAHDGKLWFGTYGKGLSCYDGEFFTSYTEDNGLSSNAIWSILEDKNENLWFGSFGRGVNLFDGTKITRFTKKEGLSNNAIWSMIEDKSGNIWFATNGGVNCFNGTSFTHFTEKEGLSNEQVTSILEDRNGNLWFGSYGGGVSLFDGTHITHFTEKEGLSSNLILSMLEDSRGNLWFGTWGGGINIYTPTSNSQEGYFTYVTEKEGLTNNIVTALQEDQQGNVWASTEDGICKLYHHSTTEKSSGSSRKEEPKCLAVQKFGKNDGLKGMSFYSNRLDSKNRMWWGSGKCLSMLDLNKNSVNSNPPYVYLNQLEINDQLIDYRIGFDSLKNEIGFNGVEPFENYPLNLELPYHKNHLTFHFIGIDWSAPHKIQYSYKIEGLNDNWSSPSRETKADYRNLPYGVHTFKLRAIGESGEWSEVVQYTFAIYPPWWHTWWARTTYGILGLFLVLGYTRLRTKQLKQRQKELELEVDAATKEIREQKEEIEEAHKEITDSIQYAKRIQNAILPPQKQVKKHLPNSFILYKPKDIVAGDFYWLENIDDKVLFAAADCTGHGVPGAMVSVVCNNGLNRSVREYGLTDPGRILDKTREIVIAEFEKSEEEVKDGMDIALFSIEGNTLKYAGANNPLWIIRNGDILETKADKQPIGKFDHPRPYTTHTVELQKGDAIYVFSDGYADQFGGEKNKKYKSGKFKRTLIDLAKNPIEQQKEILALEFETWRGINEQIDDVCVIGVAV